MAQDLANLEPFGGAGLGEEEEDYGKRKKYYGKKRLKICGEDYGKRKEHYREEERRLREETTQYFWLNFAIAAR